MQYKFWMAALAVAAQMALATASADEPAPPLAVTSHPTDAAQCRQDCDYRRDALMRCSSGTRTDNFCVQMSDFRYDKCISECDAAPAPPPPPNR